MIYGNIKKIFFNEASAEDTPLYFQYFIIFLSKYILFPIQDISKAIETAKYDSDNILQRFLSLARIYTEDTINRDEAFKLDKSYGTWVDLSKQYTQQNIKTFYKKVRGIDNQSELLNDVDRYEFNNYIAGRRMYINMLPQFAKVMHIFRLLSNDSNNKELTDIFKTLYDINFKDKDKTSVNTMYENLFRTIISLLYTIHIIIFIVFLMLFDSITLLCKNIVSLIPEKYKNIKLFSGIKTLQTSNIPQVSSRFNVGLSKNSSIRYSHIYNMSHSENATTIIDDRGVQLYNNYSSIDRMFLMDHQKRMNDIADDVAQSFTTLMHIQSKYDIEYFIKKLNAQDEKFKTDNIVLFKNASYQKKVFHYILSLIYNIICNTYDPDSGKQWFADRPPTPTVFLLTINELNAKSNITNIVKEKFQIYRQVNYAVSRLIDNIKKVTQDKLTKLYKEYMQEVFNESIRLYDKIKTNINDLSKIHYKTVYDFDTLYNKYIDNIQTINNKYMELKQHYTYDGKDEFILNAHCTYEFYDPSKLDTARSYDLTQDAIQEDFNDLINDYDHSIFNSIYVQFIKKYVTLNTSVCQCQFQTKNNKKYRFKTKYDNDQNVLFKCISSVAENTHKIDKKIDFTQLSRSFLNNKAASVGGEVNEDDITAAALEEYNKKYKNDYQAKCRAAAEAYVTQISYIFSAAQNNYSDGTYDDLVYPNVAQYGYNIEPYPPDMLYVRDICIAAYGQDGKETTSSSAAYDSYREAKLTYEKLTGKDSYTDISEQVYKQKLEKDGAFTRFTVKNFRVFFTVENPIDLRIQLTFQEVEPSYDISPINDSVDDLKQGSPAAQAISRELSEINAVHADRLQREQKQRQALLERRKKEQQQLKNRPITDYERIKKLQQLLLDTQNRNIYKTIFKENINIPGVSQVDIYDTDN